MSVCHIVGNHMPWLIYIWVYNDGNCGLLRDKASSIDWHALENDDLSIYVTNLNSSILSLAKKCIPTELLGVKLQTHHG